MKNPQIFAVIAAAMAFSVCWSGAAQVSTVTGLMIEKGFTPVGLKRARNHTYAPCKLNGRAVDLVVDTGAGGTLIAGPKLATLGLPLTKIQGDFRGVIGSAGKSMRATEIKDFQVGSYQAGSQPVGSWDLSSHPNPGKGLSMDGLLGIDFLYRHQAVIDCFQMNLFLKPPSAPSSSATLGAGLRAGGCTEIPLRVMGSSLTVATKINGRSGYLIVDTGAPNTLLREGAISGLNLRRASAGINRGMMDVGKNVTTLQMVYFTTMEIGGFSVPPQGVGVAAFPGAGGEGNVFFGYLGQDLLAYYVGVIDCHGLKLYLRLDPVVEAARKKRS
jgi:hypothetical protein